jgi:hypothetical protein
MILTLRPDCSAFNLQLADSETLEVKRSTKTHEAELLFVRAVSCDFVDRFCPGGKKRETKLRPYSPKCMHDDLRAR